MHYYQQIQKQPLKHVKNLEQSLKMNDSSIIVKEPIKTDIKVPEIDTGNSGTTIRIAIGDCKFIFRRDYPYR